MGIMVSEVYEALVEAGASEARPPPKPFRSVSS